MNIYDFLSAYRLAPIIRVLQDDNQDDEDNKNKNKNKNENENENESYVIVRVWKKTKIAQKIGLMFPLKF